ncbi:MAG: hypothetical protein ACOC10_01185, partial [Bacteroidota bacterium]
IYPNSPIALIFYNILRDSQLKYIFYKKYLTLLRSNIPVIYHLLVNNIYYPIILKSKKQVSFLGSEFLHLVKFDVQNTMDHLTGKEYEIYLFTYSNIKSNFNFLNTLIDKPIEEILDKYTDGFLGLPFIERFTPLAIKILAEESLTIECNPETAQEYFHEVKNYHYRTAFIGVNQDKRVLLKSIFRSLSPPLPQVNICKTYFEAKNWLTLNTQVEAKG